MSINFEDLKAAYEKDDQIRLLCIGLAGAGKSTLLTRLSSKDKKVHDMGNQKFKVRNLVNDALNITVWDVGEDKYVDPYWAEYHAERVVGILFVVDSTDASRFEEARKELLKALASEKLAGVPLCVLANKGDVDGAASAVKVSEALELHEIKRRAFKAFRTSATTDEGLQQALEWVAAQKFVRP